MKVVIIDTQISNLKSLVQALHLISNCEVIISRRNEDILKADKVILPGVGAFAPCMEMLRKFGCADALHELNLRGIPILGICLGMQVLASSSSEFGEHVGLGFVKGAVQKLPKFNGEGNKMKSTHIGWSRIIARQDHPVLVDKGAGGFFYFVHSYFFKPQSEQDIIATVDFKGVPIPAIIGHGNVLGCQFHPEKSGEAGLKLLSSFLNL